MLYFSQKRFCTSWGNKSNQSRLHFPDAKADVSDALHHRPFYSRCHLLITSLRHFSGTYETIRRDKLWCASINISHTWFLSIKHLTWGRNVDILYLLRSQFWYVFSTRLSTSVGVVSNSRIFTWIYFCDPVSHYQWRIQDFPEEGAPTPQGGAPTYDFANFPRKLHEIERIWTPRGGRASKILLCRSATDYGNANLWCQEYQSLEYARWVKLAGCYAYLSR